MKPIIQKIWILVVILWVSTPIYAYDFTVDGLYYTILDSGKDVELSNKNTGTLPTSTYAGSITVPSSVEYNGMTYLVTKIGNYAFCKSKVTNVFLPESINEIGKYAFSYSHQLEVCEIPDNVSEIKGMAFYECENLVKVKLPSKLKMLSQGAFAYCKTISEVIIPYSVTTIEYSSANYQGSWGPNGPGVFWGCSKLSKVQFEDGTKPIQFKDVWEGTASQNSLYANDVFYGCPLKYVYLGRVLEDSPYTSLFMNFGTLTEVKIGKGVSAVQEKAFSGCVNIENIQVGNIIPPNANERAFATAVYPVANLSVPSESIELYKKAECWREFNNINVIAIPASEIAVNVAEITLLVGQNDKLNTVIHPENTTDKSVTWITSEASVATVDENGVITAVAVGKATITATTNNGLKATCEVTVVETPASDIVIDKDALGITGDNFEMCVGDTKTINVTVKPATTTDKTVTFSSSNAEVATVDADGKVTALALGETTITITAKSGVSTSIAVTVVATHAASITLNKTEATLKATETVTLEAIVEPATTTDKTVTWTTSDANIATVDENGVVTAMAVGKATITAKATDGSNISASCTVTVVKLVNGIVLSETDITLNEGETATITATVTPDLANNKAIVWTSSNESIATVDEYGVITAHLQGKVIITAKSTDGSNVSASCTVTVVKLVTSIYINNTMVGMKIGEQTTLIAYAIPYDATNTHLRWYSEDESIATVEDGVVTAVGIGTTYICVESTDGSNIVEKCKVKVGDLSGIDSITTEAINVCVADGIISIANVPSNQTVRIFNTYGTLIKSELSTGNLMTFQPSVNGIYIVVVGTNSYKVVIR